MDNKIIKILIPAVGGQGGGVLTEWLFQTFLIEKFEVQGISLPGMSQRGGSTVYYLEAYKKNESNDELIFSQHPTPGDIDLILSQEFLELGRILEQGYGSDKATIISSTHRIYSTNEKLSVSSGIYSEENLNSIAKEFSSLFIGIDALELAKDNQLDELAINAILLGILCATNSLPLSKESFINSIEQVGIAKEVNLRSFEIGYNFQSKKEQKKQASQLSFIFNKISSENLNISKKEQKQLEEIADSLNEDFPAFLKNLIIEAVIRLTDYQGIGYAKKYLDSLKIICTLDKKFPDKEFKITEEFLKNFALLMSYEDGIRVAELKIRSNRLKRIKEDMNIKDNQLFKVVDYLKPDVPKNSMGFYPILWFLLLLTKVKIEMMKIFQVTLNSLLYPSGPRLILSQGFSLCGC
ncbi:MAG: hypothetical protein GTO02_02540 [Candidatus Dadabacteria bacterium]|nr:hypothetical protein [Candidatus Dadabacteria bacterium]NIQ13311.1 hypothetical protein [Candidatus Dadabacteria bacterium]